VHPDERHLSCENSNLAHMGGNSAVYHQCTNSDVRPGSAASILPNSGQRSSRGQTGPAEPCQRRYGLIWHSVLHLCTTEDLDMPTSVRLDSETEALLRRLASTKGQTKSEILREALHRLASESDAPSSQDGPYSRVLDLVGVGEGGPRDLARRHKDAFRERLARS